MTVVGLVQLVWPGALTIGFNDRTEKKCDHRDGSFFEVDPARQLLVHKALLLFFLFISQPD